MPWYHFPVTWSCSGKGWGGSGLVHESGSVLVHVSESALGEDSIDILNYKVYNWLQNWDKV